jgi:hypothetical protein
VAKSLTASLITATSNLISPLSIAAAEEITSSDAGDQKLYLQHWNPKENPQLDRQ